ncbi:MAG: sporulation protein YtfJ [Oscillospiraceae bacterium]|nr:sporulation protein YtfJ [Oscillospiraceae bacterium]
MSKSQSVSEFTASVLTNLRSLVDVNTIIGDPISTQDGIVIIPISKVSFGFASGGSDLPTTRPDMFGGGTGGGVTILPLGFLVVNGKDVSLLQMQSAENTGDRIVNTVPAVLDKLISLIPKKKKDEANND